MKVNVWSLKVCRRAEVPVHFAYDNNYMMRFTIGCDKIKDFKEDLDCYQVERWFESMKRLTAEAGG